MYLIKFSKQAEKDKPRLKAAGLETKAKALLNLMQDNPFQNPPPYEKLVGNLSGNLSRRIEEPLINSALPSCHIFSALSVSTNPPHSLCYASGLSP